MLSKVLLVLACTVVAVVLGGFVPLETHETLEVPYGWNVLSNEATLDHPVELIFALKQNEKGVERMRKMFWEVTDPSKKATYGKYLTIEQLTDLIQPTKETVNVVTKWLVSHSIHKFEWQWTQNNDMLIIRMPAFMVAKLLNVKYQTFAHASGATYIGTLGPYYVPEEVAPHLDIIAGVVGLPKIEESKPTKMAEEADYGSQITPPIIRTRYNVTNGLINTIAGSTHAVAEFQGQFYDSSDLKSFFDQYVTTGKQFSTIAKSIGENEQSEPGVEAMLDVEFLMGVAPNATTWFISVAPMPFWSDLMKWVSILGNYSDIPLVHSISYGSQGDYPSTSYRERLDNELQKVGLRGISIIFASGDSGSGCQGYCQFYPSYPATNIYVTAVGATRFISGNSGPEAAVQAFGSGGGFSQLFPAPSYQASFIQKYFQTVKQLPPQSAYNKAGRGNPDVAALGDEEFTVVINGQTTLVGGTSASCPVFAAIVTFLNQIRLSKNQPPLGFLNPWLYQTANSHPNAFFDVTVGDNQVGGCCGYGDISGFLCSEGWDPVTGLGTPNFEVLKTLV